MKAEDNPWWLRIEEAEAPGGFTEFDKEDSNSWCSCAIGMSPETTSTTMFGKPCDNELEMTGLDFQDVVYNDDFDGARDCVLLITARIEKLRKGEDQ